MATERLTRALVRPLLGIVIVAGLYGLVSSFTTAPAMSVSQALDVPAGDLDLGTLVENAPHEHTVTLTNPGRRSVSVVGVDGPCDWKRSGLTLPIVIPAGGQHPLKMVLTPNTTTECGRANGGEQYTPTVTIRYTAGGPPQSQLVRLQGMLRPTLFVGGSVGGRLDLNEQLAESLAEPRDIPLVAAVPIQSVAVSSQGPWVGNVRRGGDERQFIAAIRRVGSQPATFDDLLTFTPTGPDGRVLPATHLRVTGEVVDRVVAHPRDVRLGRLPVGAEASDTFHLRAVDGKSVTVRKVEPPPGISVEPVGNPVNLTYEVRLAARAGEQSAVIVFHTAGADGRELAVRVPVNYLGYTP